MLRHLVSRRMDFENLEQAMDYYYNMGWTYGLPIVPPTVEKVLSFLDGAKLESNEVLGAIPERNRIFTAEKVAINAIMAGSLAETGMP